jgi:hypothetical protein
VEEIEGFYRKFRDIEDQKSFALTIKDLKFKSVLFEIRKEDRLGNTYFAKDCLKDMHIDTLAELLGLREEIREQVKQK